MRCCRPKFHCVDLYGEYGYKSDIDINLSSMSMGLLGVEAESSHNLLTACWITCLYQPANGISYSFIFKSQVLSRSWSNMWVIYHLNQFIKYILLLSVHILLCWALNKQLSIIKICFITGDLTVYIMVRNVFNVGAMSTYKW